MANTAEGLEVGGPEGLDPNDPAAFAQIMEGRGVARAEGEEDTPDRSVASGLTTEAGPEQPARDPATGKFVSNQEKSTAVVTPPAAATDTSGDATGDAEDPEIQAVLAKYGGDVNAALKGLAGAQSLIGRRDERADALEKELAEMRGQLTGFMAAGVGSTVPLTDDQVVEIATSQIEQKGYTSAAAEAANHAHTSGDDRAYRAILEQWTLESPVDAMDFNTDFRIWQRDQRNAAEAPEQPAWATTVAEQVATDALTRQIEAVASERGVAKDSPIIEQMLPALEQMPPNILEMVGSNDQEAQAQAVRLVMDRATLLAGALAAAAATAPAETTVPATVARKLAGAAVASGALRPPETTPASTEQTREQAIAQFKRDIVEAPTTNIASGLTYGPTP